MSDINKLIEGCINGDSLSQENVYKIFYKQMLGVCMRYSGDWDEAKDTLQESFIKIFSKIKDYDGTGPFGGWVRRVVVNTNIDKIRGRKKKDYLETVNIETLFISNGKDVEEEIDVDDYMNISKEDIMTAVQSLSPACRTIFNMHLVDGFSHKQISEKLNINEGTSKSNLHKAKLKLRSILLKNIKTKKDESTLHI